MSEPFLFKKAFDLSATALGKSTSTVVKGLFILAIFMYFGIGIKSCIKKPSPTQTAQGDANIYNLQPHFGGCARVIVK